MGLVPIGMHDIRLRVVCSVPPPVSRLPRAPMREAERITDSLPMAANPSLGLAKLGMPSLFGRDA
jgi:hypothetical protein